MVARPNIRALSLASPRSVLAHADSSQLAASEADGVRPELDGPPPCEAQVDPVGAYSSQDAATGQSCRC